MTKIKLLSTSRNATLFKDKDEDNGRCCLCGKEIEDNFVRFIVRTGMKSGEYIDVHEKHFTEEAIKLINKRIGEKVAEEI